VVISTNGFPYMFYDKDEPTFEEYPNVKFFVGGHSQGGAAAVRRTNENRDKVVGVVLLAPLAYPSDSIADADIPVLLLEATNDGVLTADMKSNARRSIPHDSEHHILEGCHMSFSTLDSDETLTMFHDGPATPEQKEAQRTSTLSFVLAFMNRIASAN
jgi:alpha-beta hydrolase superfamily lysophospholipase